MAAFCSFVEHAQQEAQREARQESPPTLIPGVPTSAIWRYEVVGGSLRIMPNVFALSLLYLSGMGAPCTFWLVRVRKQLHSHTEQALWPG